MKAIKTAIFGTGFMGRVHLEAVRRVESVEAAAVVGRNAQAVERLAAGFAIPKTTTDFREVLRDASIDAVHICTPNAQHFAMAKEALQAGKHVLCEKPLTTTVAEAEELVPLRPSRDCAIACATTCVITRWSSRCAACAKPENSERFWLCRARTLKTGCCMTRIGTGGSMPAPPEHPVAWPTSDPTFSIWQST